MTPATPSLAQRSNELFRNDLAPESTRLHNERGWLEAMKYLGQKHILATPVKRLHQPYPGPK